MVFGVAVSDGDDVTYILLTTKSQFQHEPISNVWRKYCCLGLNGCLLEDPILGNLTLLHATELEISHRDQ